MTRHWLFIPYVTYIWQYYLDCRCNVFTLYWLISQGISTVRIGKSVSYQIECNYVVTAIKGLLFWTKSSKWCLLYWKLRVTDRVKTQPNFKTLAPNFPKIQFSGNSIPHNRWKKISCFRYHRWPLDFPLPWCSMAANSTSSTWTLAGSTSTSGGCSWGRRTSSSSATTSKRGVRATGWRGCTSCR